MASIHRISSSVQWPLKLFPTQDFQPIRCRLNSQPWWPWLLGESTMIKRSWPLPSIWKKCVGWAFPRILCGYSSQCWGKASKVQRLCRPIYDKCNLGLDGLIAEGETKVSKLSHLDRGYQFHEKLVALGADETCRGRRRWTNLRYVGKHLELSSC